MGGPFYKRPNLKQLTAHPSFNLPKLPTIDSRNIDNVVDYATEYIARVISPSPQEEEEDVEMACVDLAKLVRTEIRKELKKNLRNTKSI